MDLKESRKYRSFGKEDIRTLNTLLEMPNFVDILPSIKGKRILDIGCGVGSMCAYLSDNEAEEIIGIDLEPKAIRKAIKYCFRDNIKYMIMDFENISKINKKFDMIISNLALHYCKNYGKLIAEIKSFLLPGGVFQFSVLHPLATSTIRTKYFNDVVGNMYTKR